MPEVVAFGGNPLKRLKLTVPVKLLFAMTFTVNVAVTGLPLAGRFRVSVVGFTRMVKSGVRPPKVAFTVAGAFSVTF